LGKSHGGSGRFKNMIVGRGCVSFDCEMLVSTSGLDGGENAARRRSKGATTRMKTFRRVIDRVESRGKHFGGFQGESLLGGKSEAQGKKIKQRPVCYQDLS